MSVDLNIFKQRAVGAGRFVFEVLLCYHKNGIELGTCFGLMFSTA